FDGDTVTLAGDFSVTVVDDIPVLTTGTSTGSVDEGGLTSGTPGDLYGTGNDAGFAVSATGTLAGDVKFGADGPATGGGFSFVSQAAATTFIAGLGLTSHNIAVDHATINAAGTLLTALDNQNHTIFTLNLTSAGAWTFTLVNPLDHPTDNGENNLVVNLSGLVVATDFDGDAVGLSGDFSVTVVDDIPVLTTGTSTGSVDEGGLTSGAVGDLYGTGNDPGFAVSATGSLAGDVKFGADGPATGGGFSFVSQAAATTFIASLNLTSHNIAVDHATINGTLLTALDTQNHTIFTLNLTSAGAWTFTLVNPLDHPTDNGENNLVVNL